MKKMITGSLAVAALMATSSAFAAVTNDSLTTKGYVDAGLDYLYQHKQDKLKNNASTPADINATVKTSVATTGASDTHLVTEKAVRDAITNAAYDDTNLSGRVTTLETAVNGDGTTANPGLLSDVADLQEAVNGDGTTPGLSQQIADKQAQLTNGTDDMAATVKTTVGDATGTNAASDTALVTEKAVRDAIDAAVLSAGTVSAGSGVTVSGNTVSVAGLSSTTGSDNKMYILKNNRAEELSVADIWSNPWVTP